MRALKSGIQLLFIGVGFSLWSCSDDSEKEQLKAAKLAEGCTLNSNCKDPLVCTFARCHQQCAEDRDCPGEQRCVKGGSGPVCQLNDEIDCTNSAAACKDKQVCGIDKECRDQCTKEDDCIGDQICAVSGQCASTAPGKDIVDSGGNIQPDNFGGSGGAGGSGGSGGAGGSPDASAGTSGSAGTAGSGGMSGSAGTAGSGGMSGSAGEDGGAGDATDGGVTCMPPCSVGTECIAGECKTCGAATQPCCAGTCGPNLTCDNNTCACGGISQSCCGGNVCSSGISCVNGKCECGKAGQACCPGKMCTGTLSCAGVKCTCIAEVLGGMSTVNDVLVRRSDGTLWHYTAFNAQPAAVRAADSSMFIAQSLSRSPSHACASRSDGTVWCFTFPGGGSGSLQGQLGDGMTTPSTTPVQVVTLSAGGPPLSDIKKVFAGGTTSCAINSAGSVWCWGQGTNGELGTGFAFSSSVAVPVVLAGGAQLTGVDQMAVGVTHVCAHKTDNTAWCWGSNSAGAVGTGSASANILNPVQVTALFSNVLAVAAGNHNSWALVNDSTVWSWGSNTYGQLGNGTTGASSNVPVHVLAAAAGAPFSGASQITDTYFGACALKNADGSIWCWGYLVNAPTTTVPTPFTKAGLAVTGVRAIASGPYASSHPAYLGSDGVAQLGVNALTNAVFCP